MRASDLVSWLHEAEQLVMYCDVYIAQELTLRVADYAGVAAASLHD
jgi:hypothetical protein